MEEMKDIGQNPLNIDLVLENIMRFMGFSDLKKCRVVSTTWFTCATKALEAEGSLVARIRPDEWNEGGKSSVTDFVTTNSIDTYNFRLDGFDLTNRSSFADFAEMYLRDAKFVAFVDCLWDYDGLNDTLRDLDSVELLVLQTMIHVPATSFNEEHFGTMHFASLKRIDLNTTVQYSARHLACLSGASPLLREVNAFTERDTKTLITCLNECPDLVSKITTLGITSTPTPEWENSKVMMAVLATTGLQLSSLTIGLGNLNDHHAQFYHALLVSVRLTLKHLSIKGQDWWPSEYAYYLPTFPELESLEFERVSDSGEQHLDRICPNIKTLKLIASNILINHNYNTPGQGYLTTLHTFEYLNVDSIFGINRDEDAFLRVISFVRNVVVFVGQLKSAEFKVVIEGLTKLKSLTLACGSEISDDDIVLTDGNSGWITVLPKELETFVIQTPHNCVISDISLKGFAKCKFLTRLELPNTEVTSLEALLHNRNLKVKVSTCKQTMESDLC